ncbi:MAG TPA: DHA2 family efflux MFS transporter permease subunit [Gaiellaceae bacterium]|nr:DHA2 family efflux MFS transporter permease subunit [Gaiellaceae bacterium]
MDGARDAPLAPRAPALARWTLVASILGSSMAFVDGSVVNVALHAIEADLGGGLAAQQWVVDAYLLTLGSLILVGGSLGDRLGELRVFALGVASFALASVLCAAAPDETSLIVFRGLQGVAGALLTPASLAVLTAAFSGPARGAAIGQWTAWTGIAFVIGPLLGGWLVEVSSWRVIFLLNVPVALLTLLLAFRLGAGRQRRRADGRADAVGALLCVAGLGLLVAGFIEAPHLGWGDPLVPGAAVAGAALLGVFVLYERRTCTPMLPLHLFRRRNFSVGNLETLAVYGALSGLSVFLALFLLELGGYSPLQAGLALLPITVVMFLLSRLTGRLAAQLGPRPFMALGPIVAGVSVLAYTRLPARLDYWVDLLPALLGFSLGLALTVAPLTATVLADAGPGDAGAASGVNTAVARVAGLVAVAALGLAAGGGGDRLTLRGFHTTMLVVAALLIAGGIIGAVGIRALNT